MIPRRAPARPIRGRRALALASAALAALFLCSAGVSRADDSTLVIPAYAGYVTDAANVMSEPARAKLESFLDQLQKKTTVEFAVLTVPSSAPLDPSEYKVRVFEQWKIGKKGKDNGLLMLVSMQEHAIRFETGYGLEGVLPDMVESRITREYMIPKMRAGDVDGAITQGALVTAARIAHDQNVTLEWDGRELRYGGDGAAGGLPIPPRLLALIAFFIIATILRFVVLGRRWYGPRGFGGWGGGFGGFGGFGGGGFGGGGGGGSFGGFGGGSSGGGGGGGNW